MFTYIPKTLFLQGFNFLKIDIYMFNFSLFLLSYVTKKVKFHDFLFFYQSNFFGKILMIFSGFLKNFLEKFEENCKYFTKIYKKTIFTL